MDLFDLRSVNNVADMLKRKEPRIDILSKCPLFSFLYGFTKAGTPVNNAAASTSSTELVGGRYEQHMAAK